MKPLGEFTNGYAMFTSVGRFHNVLATAPLLTIRLSQIQLFPWQEEMHKPDTYPLGGHQGYKNSKQRYKKTRDQGTDPR